MSHSLRTLLRDNGLSIVLVALFAVFFVGQVITGRIEHNEQQAREGLPQVSYSEYLQSGDFLEATMENWESEFLQMACYVLLTAFLYQRGSAESKDPDEVEVTPSSRHSWWYENSLALALVGLFIMSFALHAIGGSRAYNEEELARGIDARLSPFDYLVTSRFWFESFQNWQSEFLSVWVMIVLSIFLRQKGSPESKSVDSPHTQTGTE
jgi:hypothetical protein